MSADLVVHTLNAKWITEDRFVFECPAHESKSRNSGKGFVLPDRIVIKDFGGCETKDILKAAGLTWAHLFIDTNIPTSERKQIERKRRAAEGLKNWHQSELQRIAGDLRLRDVLILMIYDTVRNGTLSEDEAIQSLEYEYCGYSELEYRFDRLLRNEGVLQLWRESRRAA